MATLNPLTPPPLTAFQAFFWPIYHEERHLTLLLSSIIFIIWGLNTLVYPFHISLLISSPHSGVEVIGFLRIFGNLPMSILFIIAYSWLHDRFKKANAIIICFSIFLIFYIIFAFLILPHSSFLSVPPDHIAQLMEDYPHIKWLFPIYGNWPISIFYVFTDVWIAFSASQFFWHTANHFLRTEQAGRLYPIFIIFGGVGGIVFSFLLNGLTEYTDKINFITKNESYIFILKIISLLNIGLCLFLFIFYKLLYLFFSNPIKNKITKKIKSSPPSVFEGFRYLFHSSYIFFIFLTLVASGIIYQLINFIWKSELKAATPYISEYDTFLTDYTLWNGVLVVLFAFGAKNIIPKLGWLPVIFMTPVISLITAAPFFVLLLIHNLTGEYSSLYQTNPHYLLATVGAFQSVVMGASLACLYDPTKEMAYIPLSPNEKLKGKVAADVLGSNCGKAGAGVIQEGLLSWYGGMDLTIVPHLIGLMGALFISWFYATRALGKKYLNLLKSSQKKS